MDEVKAICATGHRPLAGDWDIAHPNRQAVRAHLYPLLKRAYLAGFNTFMCGMAQGFDQDFALCVIQLRIEMEGGVFLTAAVPFKGQEQYWPETAQQVYREIIDQCDHVIEVCDPGYREWKYHARNKFMVDNTEEVIALWNGKPGGTKSCIKYALSVGKRVLNLLDYPVDRAKK